MRLEDISPSDESWDALWTLFGAYLNRDYDTFGGGAKEAIVEFCRHHSSSIIERAVAQIEALIANFSRDEESLCKAAEKLGLEYNPESDNLTYNDWLVEAVAILRENLLELRRLE
jgi:contact-dependent growth inhibition (CDI) system CdiI-like immunity protein